jgi:hypothetical protein
VTAMGGGATKTLALSLTVPASNVARVASAGSVTVKIGGKTQVGISGALLSGFTSTITLSMSELPKGVTAIFTPVRIAANNKNGRLLTLAAGSSAVAGKSNVTVSATGGRVTKTQVLTLTVIK